MKSPIEKKAWAAEGATYSDSDDSMAAALPPSPPPGVKVSLLDVWLSFSYLSIGPLLLFLSFVSTFDFLGSHHFLFF